MRVIRFAAVLGSLTLAGASPCLADGITLGTLNNWVLLALNNGSLSINSATSIVGNVGYSMNVAVPSAQKVGSFTGVADVYGGATTLNFIAKYKDATFNPTGGIRSGNTSGCPGSDPLFVCAGAAVNAALDQANADAASLKAQLIALYLADPVTALAGNVSQNLTGSGGINLYDVSWAYNNKTLTLTGGPDDWFVFRSSGTNSWAQSDVILNGVSPDRVLFYFTTANAVDFKVNKSGTDFAGLVFAPDGEVEYHNPATFDGRIIAKDLTLHSKFNVEAPCGVSGKPDCEAETIVLTDVVTEVVPEPATMALVATGLIGLMGAGLARRRRRSS